MNFKEIVWVVLDWVHFNQNKGNFLTDWLTDWLPDCFSRSLCSMELVSYCILHIHIRKFIPKVWMLLKISFLVIPHDSPTQQSIKMAGSSKWIQKARGKPEDFGIGCDHTRHFTYGILCNVSHTSELDTVLLYFYYTIFSSQQHRKLRHKIIHIHKICKFIYNVLFSLNT